MGNQGKEIYMQLEEFKVGFGSTGKRTRVEQYYQAVEIDDNKVEMRQLDISDQPFGEPIIISKEDLQKYTHCPDYFKRKKGPKDLVAEQHIQAGKQYLENNKFLSAEHEYDQVLSIKEDHLEANLGKGKALLGMGETEKAKEVFSRLSSIDDLYSPDNKHVFNELGIELRKKGLLEEAITNYQKALALAPDDWILFYNLARALFEKGELSLAKEKLNSALLIKPDFEEAKEFMASLGDSQRASR
jgi:tetratricopeptide (TPR) repeat protein